ncbi:MAG: 16S rRNA (guanine(527)-N(7))-methyltransferase RsmG [Immundisolibacteraceae bacterium]|nr:16S rRNA (guanine(527)-N(7))-methyltransferase RsmG [Immundisolibacteraceae bacterium]
MANSALETQLANGISDLGLTVTDDQQQQLLSLIELLQQWNQTYNLTAIRKPEAMISGHLLDSLSVCHLLPPGSLLDVGCGAGFPGLAIAICEPDRSITLLDSNQKKTRFVQHAIGHLQLKNCQVVHQRTEQYQPEQLFYSVICRAYTSLAQFAEQAGSLIRPTGQLLAMKGHLPTEEIADLPPTWQVISCEPLTVPGIARARHLVTICPQQSEGQ